MLPDKRVVRQVRVADHHPIDGRHLSGAQLLERIQAPAPGKQSLAAKDLVYPGMQPANWWTGSKIAALTSVSSAPSAAAAAGPQKCCRVATRA